MEISRHPGQGGAPIQGDQALVWLHHGPHAGLEKNAAQLMPLFLLSNLWMMRDKFGVTA